MKFFNHPIGSGNLYRKQIWKKIDGYNEKLKFKDDVYFWIKLNDIKNIRIKYLKNLNYYYYRKHNRSMSTNIIKKKITLLWLIIKYLCTKNI